MPLRFLLDEHLRGGALWPAIQQSNAGNPSYLLDATRVGDPADLPLGTPDPDILLWCERTDRILLSFDKGSLPVHLAHHLRAGHHSPGIFILSKGMATQAVLGELVLRAYAGDPAEYADCITFIP
jgi:hypothetical protein